MHLSDGKSFQHPKMKRRLPQSSPVDKMRRGDSSTTTVFVTSTSTPKSTTNAAPNVAAPIVGGLLAGAVLAIIIVTLCLYTRHRRSLRKPGKKSHEDISIPASSKSIQESLPASPASTLSLFPIPTTSAGASPLRSAVGSKSSESLLPLSGKSRFSHSPLQNAHTPNPNPTKSEGPAVSSRAPVPTHDQPPLSPHSSAGSENLGLERSSRPPLSPSQQSSTRGFAELGGMPSKDKFSSPRPAPTPKKNKPRVLRVVGDVANDAEADIANGGTSPTTPTSPRRYNPSRPSPLALAASTHDSPSSAPTPPRHLSPAGPSSTRGRTPPSPLPLARLRNPSPTEMISPVRSAYTMSLASVPALSPFADSEFDLGDDYVDFDENFEIVSATVSDAPARKPFDPFADHSRLGAMGRAI
ncbi:hypothetical protein DL93DRAFT_2072654 [Clavulina sp. PMI_390]|nr:hypothetical protein DL93DRAFT_2072654 [Clavulina sp. PMI_390]